MVSLPPRHLTRCELTQTRGPHPYTIRFRDALCKQREEVDYGTQDDAMERPTQICADLFHSVRVPGVPLCSERL
ncbi:hypothetical protein BKD26_27995 [Streptomyces sp. CB03238]|nr:hypothetical protein BKD26_27995 [Streptomyces sp. CB03238]